MRPLRYSIDVTLGGCCNHRAISPYEEMHRHHAENLARRATQGAAATAVRAHGPQLSPSHRRDRLSRLSCCLAAALAVLLTPLPAPAQALEAVTLRIDNDLLGVRGTGHPPDFDYTHGMEIAADFRGVPDLLAGAAGVEPHQGRLLVRAGQKIFTPRRDGPEPVAGERPYASGSRATCSSTETRSGAASAHRRSPG